MNGEIMKICDCLTRQIVQARWNGVDYPSLTAAAEAVGVTKAAMFKRLKKGYSSDDQMFQKTYHSRGLPPKKVRWNGTEYQSLAAASKALGVSYQAVAARIEAGYSCDSDMKKPRT